MAEYDAGNIFAKILRGEAPCIKVHEDDVSLAFMDIMPRTEGHVLVIPKLAVRSLFDISAAALCPYMRNIQTISAAAVKGMQAEGLTLQQFNEAAGGQVVFHLHFHILPRWAGVALRPPGTMGDRAKIEAHAEKIRAAF